MKTTLISILILIALCSSVFAYNIKVTGTQGTAMALFIYTLNDNEYKDQFDFAIADTMIYSFPEGITDSSIVTNTTGDFSIVVE